MLGFVACMTDERLQTISPLLIVVRMNLARTRSLAGQTTDTYPLEIDVLRTENMASDYNMQRIGNPQGAHPQDGV